MVWRRSMRAVGAAASALVLLAVLLADFHSPAPGVLMTPAGWRAEEPSYVGGEEARKDMSSFFDTLQDTSKPRQAEAPRTALHKIEHVLAKKRTELTAERKELLLGQQELAVTAALARTTRATADIERKLGLSRSTLLRASYAPSSSSDVRDNSPSNSNSNSNSNSPSQSNSNSQSNEHEHPEHAGPTHPGHAETGNVVDDAALVRASAAPETVSDECLPPKAKVDGKRRRPSASFATYFFACSKGIPGRASRFGRAWLWFRVSKQIQRFLYPPSDQSCRPLH